MRNDKNQSMLPMDIPSVAQFAEDYTALEPEVFRELCRAVQLHPPCSNTHGAYAVILEELDELWDLVKQKHPEQERLREEAIQVAVTAIRFVLDHCPKT